MWITSSYSEIESGATLLNGCVPQGTLSGHKDINDLNTPAHICKYVDGSTIYEIVQSPAGSCIQQSADVAAEWTTLNDMIINSDKSTKMFICFSTDTTIVNNLAPISINNCAVQRIKHANILGVTISSNLTWNAHVE